MGNDQGGGKKKKNPGDELFDASFEMKQQAKALEREAAKVQQQEQKERQKILNVSYQKKKNFVKIFNLLNSVEINRS